MAKKEKNAARKDVGRFLMRRRKTAMEDRWR